MKSMSQPGEGKGVNKKKGKTDNLGGSDPKRN